MKLTNEYGNVTFEIADPREQERLKRLGFKEVEDKTIDEDEVGPDGEDKTKSNKGKAKK